MAGQRRFNAHHWLNKKYPDEKFHEQKTDEIKCIVIPEPDSDEKKLALSVAENITHVHMSNTDSVKAVTDLWNTYHDYDDCREKRKILIAHRGPGFLIRNNFNSAQ